MAEINPADGISEEFLRQIPPKIFQRERFLIMKSLAKEEKGLDFTELRDMLGLTDGNLASHLRALENLGYVEYKKEFVGRRPKTIYKLTRSGMTNFETLVHFLDKSLRTVRYPTALTAP